MDIYLGDIIEFIVTSGIYLIIIGNFVKAFKKGKKKAENTNNYMKFSLQERTNDNIYNHQIQKQSNQMQKESKKQSVFSTMMKQVDKISDTFETMERNWSKVQKTDPKESQKLNSKTAPKAYSEPNKGITKNVSINEVHRYDGENEIYKPITEIKDIKRDVYDTDNDMITVSVKRSDLKKAFIMKEVLDKPMAYRQMRR